MCSNRRITSGLFQSMPVMPRSPINTLENKSVIFMYCDSSKSACRPKALPRWPPRWQNSHLSFQSPICCVKYAKKQNKNRNWQEVRLPNNKTKTAIPATFHSAAYRRTCMSNLHPGKLRYILESHLLVFWPAPGSFSAWILLLENVLAQERYCQLCFAE